MKHLARWSKSFAIVGLAAVAAFAGDAHDGQLPSGGGEAMLWAQPLVDAARPAKCAETPEIAKGIRRAVDWMQPWVKAGSTDAAWSALWNEALTLTRFHKNKPTGDYVLEPKHLDGNYVRYGLPAGRGWTSTTAVVTGSTNSGKFGEIGHAMPDGRMAATIEISVYSFGCVYYDVIDGANTTALAKRQIDFLRTELTKTDSISTAPSAKPLSKGFSRVQYVEATGKSETLGRLRLRTYYAKGSYRTYEFMVTEMRDTKDDDSPFYAWEKGVEDPELEAVLASLEEGDPKKTR